MSFAALTLDRLVVSPLNVRTCEADANSVDALAASIRAHGLLFPLIVHSTDLLLGSEHEPFALEHQGKFAALAGGRRLRALRQLAEQGHRDPDEGVDCVIRDVPLEQIVELSLSENLLRRELRPHEVHAAVADAIARGATVESFARECGQEVAWVRRQLRLGQLHPDIFAAYVDGELSAEQAQAYAATDDRALQLEAFRHFRPLANFEERPAAIRAFMKVGDAELKRMLLFVGEAIYRGNGGRFELDLFADGPDADRGRIVDETLLREFHNEKLAAIRAQIRTAIGARDLRFQPYPPQFAGSSDVALEIPLSRTDDWKKFRLPRSAQSDDVVGTIDIDREGRWTPRFWWASRKIKGERTRQPAAPSTSTLQPRESEALASSAVGYDQEARRIVRDEHGLASDGLNICRSLRRDLLRALLLDSSTAWADPQATIARDYLTWAQLRGELGSDRDWQTGLRHLQSEGWTEAEREPTELLRRQRDDQPGWRLWERERTAVQHHPAFTLADPSAALEAYLDAGPELKRAAEALLAGLALIRSANSPGFKVPVHDVLARRLGATPARLRAKWEPRPEFTGLFAKMARLEMAQPFVEPAAFRDWPKLKDKPLAGATAAALQGLQEGELGEEARRWIHPLLDFEGEEYPPAGEMAAEPAPVIAASEAVQ